MREQILCIYVFSVLFIFLCSDSNAGANEDWFISVYSAVMNDDNFINTLKRAANKEDSNLAVLAIGRKITSFKQHIDFEIEGQIAKHSGAQYHMEYNVDFVARWLSFPWDSFIDTSLAIGEGLSFATEIPEIEERHHNETSQLLNYLMFELTFTLPKFPKWSLISRLHHRSGVYGLFNGVYGGSNATGLGMKYTF